MRPVDVASEAEKVLGHIQAHGSRVRFEYGGVSTAYLSDEGVASQWIAQMCEGYFVPSGAKEADVTIYSTGDPALYASLRGLASQDSAVEKHEYVEIPFTDSVALIGRKAGKPLPREDVYLLLFKKERRIVLVTSGDLEVRREEGMQTLRAAMKWLLVERGWIPLHAACVARDGRAVCVAGQKGSGKTSTLLNLLVRNGCDLLAADKFLVRDAGSHLQVCGLPGKLGVRIGSAIVQPRLLTWLEEAAASFFPRISPETVRHIAATNTPEQLRHRGEKILMLPTELANLFGRSITPTAPLGLLLIPVFDLNIEGARLDALEPEQASEMLLSCYVSILSKGEGFLLHFFDLSDALIKERLAGLLADHLPEVASYAVHQNHMTNEQTAKLVEALL
jgi:hypothetical protein